MKEFVEGLKKHLEAKYSWLGDVSYLMADIDSFAKAFEKKEDENGWIRWEGGKCPVEMSVRVDIKMQDGFQYNDEWPDEWNWDSWYGENNIIAYRLHKED